MNNQQSLADAIYEQGFYIIDNFLLDEHYSALQKSAVNIKTQGLLRKARVGLQTKATVNSSIRADEIYWLDEENPESVTEPYFLALGQIAEQLNRSLFLGLAELEAHVAAYEPGAFYKKHVDQFAENKSRSISTVYYLNEDWEDADGGELRLYDLEHQKILDVKPLANRLICFKSDMPHEVLLSHRLRYSIAAWFKTRS